MDDNYMYCVNAIKQYDKDLYEHCYRTAELAKSICDCMGKDSKVIQKAAMVHDIGKIVVPNDIIFKYGPLSESERKLVDLHSFFGYSMLNNLGIDEKLCMVVLFHHGIDKARFQYIPNPPKEALMDAEILRVVDAFDAITSQRSYAPARTAETALDIMHNDKDLSQYIVGMIDFAYQKRKLNWRGTKK